MRRSFLAVLHPPYFGTWVVRAAFLIALFGWGVGFYGPPIFLHTVIERTGWALELVSAAITVHFLAGALCAAQLPRIHRRFGVAATTRMGAIVASVALLGWATAPSPTALFVAALASGVGWATMGAVALNLIVSPWYTSGRPAALSAAYNGASIAGVLFSPLWVALISGLGFLAAAAAVGVVTSLVVWALAVSVLSRQAPAAPDLPTAADGASQHAPAGARTGDSPVPVPPLPARAPWRDARLATIAAAMALGLFAQLGLLAHLFTLLVPELGRQSAGWMMAIATACALGGRTIAARWLERGADRRRVAIAFYAIQLPGMAALAVSGDGMLVPIIAGMILFGLGLGNATSLPPLIAQAEFAADDVPRAVALIVSFAQATYAFAPAAFGALLAATVAGSARLGEGTGVFFAVAAALQVAAIGCLIARTGAPPCAATGRDR